MTRLAILGFGLIGGSIAQALAERAPRAWRVSGWSPSGRGPAAARAAGLIDVAAPDPHVALDAADLVLLAADPRANVELVGRVGPSIAGAGAVLTDVTSVQQPMAAAAAAVTGLRAVGGHPMSGREQAGFQAATADLFVDRPWVVLPGALASLDDVALVERLATDCGARPLRLDPAAHDAAVALISHLPLVLAASLVEAAAADPAWPHARELAAQGWRDTTRLARGDPALGAGMLSLNAGAVAAALRRQRATLDAWQARLDQLAADTDGEAGDAAHDVDALLAALEDIAELASGGRGDRA